MAKNELARLQIVLEAESSRLQKQLEQVNGRMANWEKRASKSVNNVKSNFIALGAALAGLAAATGFASLIRSTVDAADKIEKLNKRLGASTEALSEYQHVANLSGVSFETLTMGWQRMTRRVAEAAQGMGEARGALLELGIDAKALSSLKPEEQFEVLADALSKVGNQSDRVRLSMKLFDSEGVSLLQTMTNGADGIRQMRLEARELGLTLSQDAATAAAKAKDQMTKLDAAMRGFANKMLIEYGPAITFVFEAMTGGSKTSKALENELFDLQDALDQAVDRQQRLKEILAETPNNGGASGYSSFFGLFSKSNTQVIKDAQVALAQTEATIESTAKRIDEIQKSIAARTGTARPDFGGLPGITPTTAADQQAEKDLERQRQRLQTEYETLRTSLLDKETLETESWIKRQFILDDALQNNLITEDRHRALTEELEQQHQDRLLEIYQKANDSRLMMLDQAIAIEQTKRNEQENIILGSIQNITAGVAHQSRLMFEINKAAAIAEAALNIPATTSAAYKWGTSVGGPYFGAAMAAVAFAAQSAKLLAIKNTQFGGAGSVPPSSAGTGAGNVVTTVPPDGFNSQQQNRNGTVTIQINADNIYGVEHLEQLIVESVQRAANENDVIIIDSSSRNGLELQR